MRHADVLIIGGGAAGTTAAETYRNGGGTGAVVIVSDEPHPLYSRVLLPHAVKGKISPEKVFLKRKEWYAEKGVELLAARAVLRVEPKRAVVVLDGDEEISYGKLVIAVGGKPRVWDVPGAKLDGILRLQTFDDAQRVHAALGGADGMVIVGSGFIALEFAAMAIAKRMKATLLNRGPHFWASVMGPELGSEAEKTLASQGIAVRHGIKAVKALGATDVEGVEAADGERFPASIVGLGIGIDVPVAPFSGMQGDRGIRTDAFLETGRENIWAAGDCAEFDDQLLGLRHAVGNWTNAVAQGRHVGQALLGKREPFKQLTQYTTACVPGLNLIFIGETKHLPGSTSETRVLGPGKAIETRLVDGRAVGCILLNCPEERSAAIARIMRGAS